MYIEFHQLLLILLSSDNNNKTDLGEKLWT